MGHQKHDSHARPHESYMTKQKHDSQSHLYEPAESTAFLTELHTSTGISQEQREHMIAEAAYYIAEHRQFQGGDPIRDWLQAEDEIDRKIIGT